MKVLKYLIEEEDGREHVHFDSPFSDDSTLCGMRLDGSLEDAVTGGYEDFKVAKTTRRRVNCSQCIQILEYCKAINRNHIIKTK